MRHKDGPYRQCVSCRGVFRKEELLRFVQQKEKTILFDERQSKPGRGYYLCPEKACFLNAWKNKKAKALFRDETSMKRTLTSVCQTLLSSAEGMGGLPMNLDGAFRKGQEQEALLVPGKALIGTECMVNANKTQKILPILRNLWFYERLSSKGHVL